MTTVGVINFPGSNCEFDVCQAITGLGGTANIIWHGDTSVGDVDAVVIPGGFAHGDYLRPGAIARFSPIMDDVVRFAETGHPVLGICNGFQVLTEAGLLPGALMQNNGLRFMCKTVTCTVVSSRSVFTNGLQPGASLQLPINNYHGNFSCDETTLRSLIANDQIVLRYADNPNGSVDAIAGISNINGNVVGLMPHPERAMRALTGSADGVGLLQAFLNAAQAISSPA